MMFAPNPFADSDVRKGWPPALSFSAFVAMILFACYTVVIPVEFSAVPT